MISSRLSRASESSDEPPTDLKPYDGLRVVVMLTSEEGPIPFYGTARWESHPTLGNVLCIEPEIFDSGSTAVFLSESLWVGTIEKIEDDEADYRFTPAGRDPPSD